MHHEPDGRMFPARREDKRKNRSEIISQGRVESQKHKSRESQEEHHQDYALS